MSSIPWTAVGSMTCAVSPTLEFSTSVDLLSLFRATFWLRLQLSISALHLRYSNFPTVSPILQNRGHSFHQHIFFRVSRR